jgi:hypothetical protein
LELESHSSPVRFGVNISSELNKKKVVDNWSEKNGNTMYEQ